MRSNETFVQRLDGRARRARALVCALAIIISNVSAPSLTAAQQRARERVLLGVRLRPELAAWLEEIEKGFGKEVYAEFAPLGPEDESEGFVGGENYVTERGTPILRLNLIFRDEANSARREATLAHELLHLRQRARGFAAYAFDDSQPAARGVPLKALIETGVEGDLMEAIEHKLILPEMRRLGLDTVRDMIGFLDWAKRQRRATDQPYYAVYFLRATFEYTDAAKLKELERVYRRNGWARSLTLAEKMVQILRTSSVETPSDMTDTYLRCLNELFGGLYRFTARPAPTQTPRDRIFPTMLVGVSRAQKK